MKPLEMAAMNTAISFGIKNKLELAHMLARFSVESGNFERLSESLNYTPEALLLYWRSHFTPESANKLGRTKEHPANQIAIANVAYGGRMGNNLENDGWVYRGGGLIQLTGKAMYLKFLNWLNLQGKHLDLTIETVADWVRTNDGAVISAVWYWVDKGCGVYARKDDVNGVCKAVNGGSNGLKEQEIELAKYKVILQV